MRFVWLGSTAIVATALALLIFDRDGPHDRERPARLPAAIAATLPGPYELWNLCPVRDAGRRFYERTQRKGRRQLSTLIREVRRRPDAVVRVAYVTDEEPGIEHELITVRDLAESELDTPGIDGVPCARQGMERLQRAVDDA